MSVVVYSFIFIILIIFSFVKQGINISSAWSVQLYTAYFQIECQKEKKIISNGGRYFLIKQSLMQTKQNLHNNFKWYLYGAFIGDIQGQNVQPVSIIPFQL